MSRASVAAATGGIVIAAPLNESAAQGSNGQVGSRVPDGVVDFVRPGATADLRGGAIGAIFVAVVRTAKCLPGSRRQLGP